MVRIGDSFLITGEKPQRWVRQTDFSNDEAVGYLADRLARLGVEEALAEAGAEPGAEVLIGDPDDAVVFDWDPAAPMSSGASTHTRHGTSASSASAPAAPTPGCYRDDRAGNRGRRQRPDIATAPGSWSRWAPRR